MKNKALFSNRKLLLNCFIFCFIFGLCAHAFVYFNTLYSHDSLLIYQDDYFWQISLGRYLQPFYVLIRGNFYAPWLIGIISLAFISLSAYLICLTLNINNKISVIITCGILATNHILTLLNNTYIFETDIYMLALLLAALAVYLSNKNIFFSIISLTGSIAFYQSYLQVAVFLFMCLVIISIINNNDIKKCFITGLKYILIIISSLIIYYIGLKIMLIITNTSLSTSYNSISGVFEFGGITGILENIKTTYTYFINFLFSPNIYGKTIVKVVNIILCLLLLFMIFFTAYSNKISKTSIILLVSLLFLIPFGIGIVCFISKGVFHSLMMYSYYIIYIFFISIAENTNFSNFKILNSRNILLPIVLVIICNVIYANQVYLFKNLIVDNTRDIFNRIIMRMEETDGYIVGETPVVIIGNLEDNELAIDRYGFTSGEAGFSYFTVTYYNTYKDYFNKYLGYPVNLLNVQTAISMSEDEYIKNMPSFPYNGSIQIIDGTMVIKLS